MERTARSGAAGRPQGNRDTADACLAEAERLFAAQGFAGTGMRDIAGRSGVTVATLAYHFGSKEKLYGRVLGRVAESIGAYLPEVETVAPEPAAVAEALAGFLDWALDHPDYAALLLREAGHDVSGVFMVNWTADEAGYCNAAEDFASARAVAEELDIPLQRVDFSATYHEQVFQEFK